MVVGGIGAADGDAATDDAHGTRVGRGEGGHADDVDRIAGHQPLDGAVGGRTGQRGGAVVGSGHAGDATDDKRCLADRRRGARDGGAQHVVGRVGTTEHDVTDGDRFCDADVLVGEGADGGEHRDVVGAEASGEDGRGGIDDGGRVAVIGLVRSRKAADGGDARRRDHGGRGRLQREAVVGGVLADDRDGQRDGLGDGIAHDIQLDVLVGEGARGGQTEVVTGHGPQLDEVHAEGRDRDGGGSIIGLGGGGDAGHDERTRSDGGRGGDGESGLEDVIGGVGAD